MKIQYYHRRKNIQKNPRTISVPHDLGSDSFSGYSKIVCDTEIGAKGGTTIAMEEIPVDMFKQLTADNILLCQVGKAECSNKDNYNKKVGRNIAQGRMKEVPLFVESICIIPKDTIEVILQDQTGHQYTLILKEGASTVRFVNYI